MEVPQKVNSLPLSVPKSMRTNRCLPRIIAIVAVVACGFVNTLGVKELANLRTQKFSVVDGVFEVGTRFWGVTLASNKNSCIGFIKTTMKMTEHANIRASGTIIIPFYTKPLFLDLSIDAIFSERNNLSSLMATFNAGKNTLNVRNYEVNSRELHINLSSPLMRKEFVVNRPHPIFLVERYKNHFSLRLPKSIQHLIDMQETSLPSFKAMLGLEFNELQPTAALACKKQVSSIDEEYTFNQEVLDIGTYLSLMGMQKNDRLLATMRGKPQ